MPDRELLEDYPLYRAKEAYKCVHCGEHRRYFLLSVDKSEGTVQKVGQWPAWDIGISKSLARRLGKHAPIFKHGLISESQGYGIGAFGYYRRIVEEVIDQLLADIREMIPAKERARYTKALQRVAETRVTETKIKLVKDLLPDSLRPDGVNPLAALHNALSEGLHAKDDKECLKIAETIRSILAFLTSQVEEAKEARKQFTDDMRKLLGGKTGAKK